MTAAGGAEGFIGIGCVDASKGSTSERCCVGGEVVERELVVEVEEFYTLWSGKREKAQ